MVTHLKFQRLSRANKQDAEDANIVIGSNNDWYLIYGESDDADIEISDLAIVGAINAEKNGNTERGNIKLLRRL